MSVLYKVPNWVPKLLERWLTPQGKPLYRIVWSEDRLQWENGQMRKKYGEGKDRWILEKWCPPEMYGNPNDECWTEEWLGEFPRQCDYEHCFTFDQDGVFIPLRHDLVELLVRCIEAGKMHTRSERWRAIREAQEKAEKERHQHFSDAYDDAFGPFDKGVGQEYVAPGKTGARKRKPDDIKFNYTTKDVEEALPGLPRRGFGQITGE